MSRGRFFIGVLVVTAGLSTTACESVSEANSVKAVSAEQTPTTTTTTTADRITDEDISLAALDASWESARAEVCPMYLDTLASGVDEAFLQELGVQSFEDGAGEPLTPALRTHLIELMESC